MEFTTQDLAAIAKVNGWTMRVDDVQCVMRSQPTAMGHSDVVARFKMEMEFIGRDKNTWRYFWKHAPLHS